jgi:hypothetical protein
MGLAAAPPLPQEMLPHPPRSRQDQPRLSTFLGVHGEALLHFCFPSPQGVQQVSGAWDITLQPACCSLSTTQEFLLHLGRQTSKQTWDILHYQGPHKRGL